MTLSPKQAEYIARYEQWHYVTFTSEERFRLGTFKGGLTLAFVQAVKRLGKTKQAGAGIVTDHL